MKRYLNLFWSAGLFMAALFLVSSCKKSDDVTETNLPRQFRPGAIRVASSTATSIKLEWDASLFTTAKGVKYDVEVSKDINFAGTPDLKATVDTSGILLSDDKLSVRQKYYARVKANSVGTTAESGWVASAEFTIPGLQLVSVAATEVIDNSAIVRWTLSVDPTSPAVKLVLTPQTGTAITLNLTQAEYNAQNRIVTGLAGNTSYTAELFRGTRSQGTASFKTKTAIVGTNIIDLRNITTRPNVLADTLPLIPAGSTVILKKGLTYDIPVALNLSKTVTIIGGDDLFNPKAPLINMVSNFNITANANIDSIVFRNVTLRSDGFASKYVFNISNAATIGKMSFQSCEAAVFRGLVRLQTAVINVNDFVVNDCVMDSLSNYGLITVDNVNCKVNNFILTNSTFYKCEKIITSRQNSVTVNINNCTFNEVPLGGGANYLLDYSTSGTNNVTGGIKVTNSIMGPGWLNAGSRDVRGIRVGTATVDGSGTYVTSDYTATANPVSGVITYSKTAAELFTNPGAGNFKIKDTTFPGRSIAGDPRWRL